MTFKFTPFIIHIVLHLFSLIFDFLFQFDAMFVHFLHKTDSFFVYVVCHFSVLI